MSNRKRKIEEILESFQAIKNKMQSNSTPPDYKDCVTHSQLFVLAIIRQHCNIGIKEISKKLNISSSAATQLVDGLVENGYAVRKTDLKDRRALQLELTAKGYKYIVDLNNNRLKNLATLFDALNDDELVTFLTLHKKILAKN
ncbi:MAG: MarR family transcriptional regulator [Patescibacteria group bacterium]|nr:MarR family transcriptional regulator [Patescibacteria group bacterium]